MLAAAWLGRDFWGLLRGAGRRRPGGGARPLASRPGAVAEAVEGRGGGAGGDRHGNSGVFCLAVSAGALARPGAAPALRQHQRLLREHQQLLRAPAAAWRLLSGGAGSRRAGRGEVVPPERPREKRVVGRYAELSIASADMDLNQLEAFLTAQTKKQGGITSDQAAVIAKFWKNHRIKIHESLINQSCWDNILKNMNWRVDLKSQSRHVDQINTPVAIVEMELGKNGQESEFLCLEFDEAKVSQMLKKLSEIEESMTLLTQTT
ncbi:COMM domain-containing protein 1-like isoform X5 [Grus americana]|nr:COMM domain-containing protein 1-like isoform X5 [Grus americana]